MANWSNPQLTSTYTNFLAEVKARDDDLAVQFSTGTISNQPDGAIKWDSSANIWKKWSASGSSWGALTATYAFPAITATTGTFSSNVAITGTLDASSTVSGTAFIPDGSSAPSNGIYLPSSNTLGFSVSSGQKASLNATGLKLGTGTASCKLDVDGGIKVAGGQSQAGYGFNSNDTDGGMYSPADNTLTFKTNNARRVSIVGDKTGINVDNPAAHLHLTGGGANATTLRVQNNDGYFQLSVDGDTAAYQADQYVWKNQADNSTWATLNSTGLGINVVPSSFKFDVTGNSRITGDLTVSGSISGTVTKATDLDINASNKVLYQASNGDTGTLPQGTSGQFLKSNGASTPSWASIDGEVPIGGIIIWSGASNAIPTRWSLCSGQTVNGNVTPDLRNRFVVGAGSTYNVSATGGFTDAINISHTHTTSTNGSHGHGINDPGHTHTYRTWSVDQGVDTDSHGHDTTVHRGSTQYNSGGKPTGISVNSGGGHEHTANASGSSGTGRNLPPYYALCYIMRTS